MTLRVTALTADRVTAALAMVTDIEIQPIGSESNGELLGTLFGRVENEPKCGCSGLLATGSVSADIEERA